MNMRILLLAGILVSITACDVKNTAKSRGPIVLGDSSTIVTETDEEALRDLIPDLKLAEDHAPQAVATTTGDTTTAPKVEPANQPQPAASKGPGLNVPFKEVNIFIPNIVTRSYSKIDLTRARGASYELTGSKLPGARLQVSGGTVTRVTQRYETVVVVQRGNEQLALESLGKYTSAWQNLSGSGGSYTIAGLEPSKLGYKQVSGSAIRNAVQQAARRNRLNRKETQDWQNAVRSIRAADQPPARVALRSVMWRIEGKDASGKSFTKELRIDVPL